MSAGKSTAINALIGQELLHSANEATTATITRIHNKDGVSDFMGKAYSYQDELLFEQLIDKNILRQWNANPTIKTIDITGNIKALNNDKAQLVIYDTPGPNNSQDDNHSALTMQVIADGNYGLIVYILNATQLGVNDDHSLLEKIKQFLQTDSHKHIIFLLNKADQLDPEKGETLDKMIANTKQYLANLGFDNLIIIPTSVNYALTLQKALGNIPLTRFERATLKNALTLDNRFIISANIPNTLKLQSFDELQHAKAVGKITLANGETVKKDRLNKALLRTGFGVLQALLQQKISNFHS